MSSMPDVTFREAAASGCTVLAQQFQTPHIFDGNFWFGGNTLRTFLDYLVVAELPDTDQLVSKAFQIYTALKDASDWWRDDYAWWGTAFVYAIQYQGALGYAPNDPLFTDVRAAAADCWEKLYDNWSNDPYPGVYPGPPITGGVFNTRQDVLLAGRNSVTNEGFWLLSQGLAPLNPGQSQYAIMAKAEQDWFSKWLALPDQAPNMNGILNGNGLVLERPLGNPDAPDWYWSGDQGLFVASVPNPLAGEIAQSAVKNMSDNGILHENLDFTAIPTLAGFIADYATGKGVLMRSVARYVVANWQTPPPSYVDFFTKNATMVWCNRLPKEPENPNDPDTFNFSFNWNWKVPGHEPRVLSVSGKSQELCDLITQAAGQDALNAALRFTPDAPIVCPS
jgi:hypothetical protein